MPIATRSLAQMCRRVGTGLRSGVDVVKVWDTEALHGNAAKKRHATEVKQQVSGGESLAKALRATDGYFPPIVCELVEVGEATGRVDEILLRLADHYDHQLQLRRTFMGMILFPMIQLAAGIVIVGLLILILGMIQPGLGLFGLSGPGGLVIYTCCVISMGAALTLLTLAVLRGWFGGILTQIGMKIPVIGGAIEAGALARMTWTLAAALDAGVDARSAVRMSLNSTQNALYEDQVITAQMQVQAGKAFHETFLATGVFNEEFLTNLEVAEMSGTYSDSLYRLAGQYQEKFESATKMLAVAAGWLCWALVAAIIIFTIFSIVVSVIMPPYQEAFDFLENG